IYNDNGTIESIADTTFSGNTASSYGGAIYNDNGTIESIADTTFSGNTASSYGGAIYNSSGTIESIADTTFSGNTASSYGGAIYNYSTISSISDSTFSSNTAKSNGGAIYNKKTINEIVNSTFNGNTASSRGGAIYNDNGTIESIADTIFSDNTANSDGGAIYNYSKTTIESIADATFSGNTAYYCGGAIYNAGTISEIVNSTFKGNFSTSTSYYGGAIYNLGTMTISARGSIDEDGNITEGLTEFTGNYVGSKLTESNNWAIYNSSGSITLNADTYGTILMNDKIRNYRTSDNLKLTGDATGTIKLFDTVFSGTITADKVNITTANSKIQSYFSNFNSDESAKWTIDVDFANTKADTFTVGSGTGIMYIDNLNVMGNTDQYTKVKVLDKTANDTTELKLKDAVVDFRDTLSDTVYNDETFHQEEGYAVASSKTWNGTSGDAKYGVNNMISQCIDEELDGLNLIVSSDKNEVRNFVFKDGSTYTLNQDLDSMYYGTLNVKGLEGSTSTIDANGHKLFNLPSSSYILNLSDVKLTGAKNIITGNGKINISGKDTTLDGIVSGTTTLNSGSLHIASDTLAGSNSSLTITDGTLALTTGDIESYNIYRLTPGTTGKLGLDIDLKDKVSDQMSITNSSGIITVSSVDFINDVPKTTQFVVQVLKNGYSSTLKLALADNIKHYVFDDYYDVLADEVQVDTDFNQGYYNRLYKGSAIGELSLTTTDTINDSILVDIKVGYDDTPEKTLDSLGDTLDLITQSNLSTRNFNSNNAKDVYNVGVDLGEMSAGNFNINGTLDESGNLSTVNFKNHKALQIGENTHVAINNARLTGNRNLISVGSSSSDLTLNNAYINGNIIGNEKFNLLIDGTDTTTVMGSITNADVTFKNGGLVVAENTFADDSVSLKVERDAYVYLNDGDISNYHFSNIDSSSSSKYGLDLDLEERCADVITAEGTGRIVFEKFDIVNRNLSNVNIGEDYTIRILHTTDDSLQLAISETVQLQLAKEYKLGTVHEITRMDEVVPVADWGTIWEVEETDIDVYGKLKLATTVTTNDSLHLYELRKDPQKAVINRGDTLMLMSILETEEDRRFYTDSVSRYNLSVDIGDMSSGKMSLEGATDGSALSVIDMGTHKGFKLSDATELSATDIEFVNAGYKDGSLFNLTNSDAVLNLGNVIITDTASTNAIKNSATVNFTGGRNILYSGITGTGVTNVTGGELHLTEGLSITQAAINVVDGLLTVDIDSQLFSDLTVETNGRVRLANANALTSSVSNDGEVEIQSGTLLEDISGAGTTVISGTVINDSEIDQDVSIVSSGELTTSADDIGGLISNSGILNLSGTLQNVVKENGTTNVAERLTLAVGAGISGTLNLNDGFISTQDNLTSTYEIGTMLNEGSFDIDVDLSKKSSDLFNVGNGSKGLVYIETINFLKSTTLSEGESIKIQVLETNGTDAIQIALNEALKAERIAIGTVTEQSNDLHATVSFDEKYHDNNLVGTLYATLTEGTTKTTNDSIELSYSGIEWGDPSKTERKDTLKELTQYDTDEDKNFNFKKSNDKYTVEEDLGEATNGVLNINGVSDGEDKSEIDLNNHGGFKLTNDTTLNINNVKIGGGKDDKLIVASNPDAEINIKNSTIDGDIDGNDTDINISGGDDDTTILNGKVTGSKTTLDGGTLKFKTDTFEDEDDTLTITKGRVYLEDDKVDTYKITKLTSSEEGRYSIDVDLSTNTSDKLDIENSTSNGTVYVDEINFINGKLHEEFKTQILETHGNDNIQVKLSDEIKNTVYDLGTTERTWDDLKANVDFDETFHDFSQLGDIYGSIREATSVTTNDSIELVKNAPVWRDEVSSKDRLDTLHELSVYATEEDKNFNFKSGSDVYGSKADVGLVDGTLSVNGVSDSDGKSEIDLSGYSGFKLGSDSTLNLTDLEMSHGKNNTLISANESGGVVNIENNTLHGNILGNETKITITGDESDRTILDGRITGSDTTLNGGTLEFNTDTFGDNDDTLTVNKGRVDIQDGSVDTYDVTKLTSSEKGRYSIDLDLSDETSDKFNITDTTSSGTVYIDSIRYLNGDISKEFKSQVLETHGNDGIQIKLSDEIKSSLYDLGMTERSWDDLKSSVYFDELFHDYHQEGVLQGSITEATSKTTNDSIALEVTGTKWGDTDVEERLDTLHELSVYESETDKSFNFRTSEDEYASKTDVGSVNGTLSLNGVQNGDSKSSINLKGHSGFDLVDDSVLNITDLELGGGKSDNLVVALAPDAVVNIENGTLNGNIRGNNTEINISGDVNDTTLLNGLVTDSDTTLDGGTLKFNTNTFGDKDDTLTVKSGRVDLKDSRVDTYDVTKLTSSEAGKYSIDVDLTAQKSDKFNITDVSSSGTVYIDTINYINGELPSEFTVQVLDTKGNNDIQIKLSDEIKDKIYDFGTTEKTWDDLKANVDFDETFHDYTQVGDLRGSIKEATTSTTNDSISLKIDAPIWHERTVSDRLDTLHEISAYKTDIDKSFNFKTSVDVYESKTDVGDLNGTLSVKGVSDGESKSSIDLKGHGGFGLKSDSFLTLTDLELVGGKDATLISSITSGGVVNIENNTLHGNILGNETKINITGNDKDTTVLDGRIIGSDTTLDGGTLKFNTDTFGDKDDTLTVLSGHVDVQDSKIDTYDITKLTSSAKGRYSIDIDLSNEIGDKLNITDTTSSGTVNIDDINYINGELPSEFIAQILETNGNDGIQIKLSDEIKEKIYNFGKTQRNWDDLKADVSFDELFHDYHQEGTLTGTIKEATTKTTNDSISLKADAPVWDDAEVSDRLDTLHEISAYSDAPLKTFNFKTSEDEYDSKADVGSVNGELSINGVKASGKYSTINLKGFKGFELIKNSKLNINRTRVSNGADNTLLTARDSESSVTLNNSQVDGVITGVNGYTVNITGDATHVFDVRNEIQNANINVDTVQLDMYNTSAFSSSSVTMNSGTLNLTADRLVSDLSSDSFSINGTFNIMADADLSREVMDKLPSATTIAPEALLQVSGINLLSDTLATSVSIPFAYSGFKDQVSYIGSSELSQSTQITTAYAPIFKYDIRYENREDMGYFVFSRHTSGRGNPSDSFNPSVLASPVATQAAGQSAMNEAFRYVFEHADAFTQLPMLDRLSAIKANQTAMSTDFNHNLGSLCNEHNNKAGWYRPYSTFETIHLDNGPRVSATNYGSLVGYDSDFRSLPNGWTNVGTGYIGYNGSQLRHGGVDTTTNGGLLGITETFYKGNFWTALTATVGASVAETRTMYGKEDSTMLMAGIGSKTGYNFEFKEGKYIIQPIMFMSYTFVNTFDYTSASGLRIENDPMHTIQLNPRVRVVGNFRNGWQPYASIGAVWNLMNNSSTSANGVKLPEMHTKPYVEYGVGVQKQMKDRFTAFGQAMIRNGGRTGISFTAGFRWALGHDQVHDHSHDEVNGVSGLRNASQSVPRTILKQLSASDRAKLGAKPIKYTTITSNGATLREL
ncbi:hypothetical protein HDR58_00155, partial [bacterium]|nr:hypothetical protein [bacterium]